MNTHRSHDLEELVVGDEPVPVDVDAAERLHQLLARRARHLGAHVHEVFERQVICGTRADTRRRNLRPGSHR